MKDSSVAEGFAPLFRSVLGGSLPVAVRFWDGSQVGAADAPATIEIRTPRALRRVLYAPGELGFARAYVLGEIEIHGDLEECLRLVLTANPDIRVQPRAWAGAVVAAARTGVLGPPLAAPDEEVRLRGNRHSQARDAAAITHHYDVSNNFYAIALGPSMAYSCARFESPEATLEKAQESKHEHVARKLGLGPGMRLLDVGCGWGGMAIHAAAKHGVNVTGITLSTPQWELARKRVGQAGVEDLVQIRLQDYRDLGDEQFDAVSSIGMFEHVGHARRDEYFKTLARVLRPQGRLLNHAISTPGGAIDKRTFAARYVFPDGELQDVSDAVLGAEAADLEVRDVESLREHYAMTLSRWLANVEAQWSRVVDVIGERRARIWRLHMTGSIVGFERGSISVHQLLAVKPGPNGESGMPLVRPV
ncbi:MAG: cyclopropane-fatty-acyl-phospholipid synthase family protein [Actinomycetota bacterium]|nr:cyclopropane-fatty-acyl-phospholipid synthase family protein [Actinomycetota bacterium]